ncbi:hypothetical protein [Xenorhabdus bharatensis]|uniref:hypothetical protein n=1 Tax=Xenorhabdus bharatensis TaxID=3136256 RepID=UPI0030F3EC56
MTIKLGKVILIGIIVIAAYNGLHKDKSSSSSSHTSQDISNTKASAGGSPELKAESQVVIRKAGYQCNIVDDVYPAILGGSVTVFCDDNRYQYTIKDHGGRYIVEVNN